MKFDILRSASFAKRNIYGNLFATTITYHFIENSVRTEISSLLVCTQNLQYDTKYRMIKINVTGVLYINCVLEVLAQEAKRNRLLGI